MTTVPLSTMADVFGCNGEVHCTSANPQQHRLFPSTPRRLDHYQLLLFRAVEGRVRMDSRFISLHDQGVLVVLPGTYHTFEGMHFEQCQILAFSRSFFNMRYNQNVLAHFPHLKHGADDYTMLASARHARIEALLRHMTEELTSGLKGNLNVLRSLVNIALVELDRSSTTDLATPNQSSASLKLNAFTELVEQYFAQEKNPTFYAERLHITGNYLNKICKEADGRTAGEHVRDRVLLEAKRLLLHTTLAVNEVADTLGYDNVPWFITFFKQQTGYSPKQFRAQQGR